VVAIIKSTEIMVGKSDGEGRLMRTRGHCGGWRLAVCSVVFLLLPLGARTTQAASGTVNVFYAGSLVNTNENLIGPACRRHGCHLSGKSGWLAGYRQPD
jgi:hypothetical protein